MSSSPLRFSQMSVLPRTIIHTFSIASFTLVCHMVLNHSPATNGQNPQIGVGPNIKPTTTVSDSHLIVERGHRQCHYNASKRLSSTKTGYRFPAGSKHPLSTDKQHPPQTLPQTLPYLNDPKRATRHELPHSLSSTRIWQVSYGTPFLGNQTNPNQPPRQ